MNKEKTTIKVCKKLNEVFLVKSLYSRINLKVQLFGFKMDLSKSLEANLDELKKMTIELAYSSDHLLDEN